MREKYKVRIEQADGTFQSGLLYKMTADGLHALVLVPISGSHYAIRREPYTKVFPEIPKELTIPKACTCGVC